MAINNQTGDGTTLLDRTLGRLLEAWREIAGAERRPLAGTLAPDLPESDLARLRAAMEHCLEGRGGEVSARQRAADLGRAYLALDATGRRRFLHLLASAFDADRAAVDAAVKALGGAKDDNARRPIEATLRAALVPRRIALLTQFNALPEGIKFLVNLRAELRGFVNGDPALAAFELDLRQLLAGWFDVGFLDLRRITWQAPALLLEKLIAYEAVHEIRSWADLKNRLDSDRRCFAFFHPRMPDEPLIFVEVALVKGMADDIQALLDEGAPANDPRAADSAIFYSISNAQKGLVGISFGNFLIKRVVDELNQEFPKLATFATLSPMPGFRPWLEQLLGRGGDDLIGADEAKGLAGFSDREFPPDAASIAGPRQTLLRLGAHYLLESHNGGRVRDPVAHFHLTNGARVERLNWLADSSSKGLRESAGMMVNYLYKPNEIERNHESYSGEGKVAASSRVRRLLKG